MPPPQTRTMFMFASRTDSSRRRYFSRVTRVGKISAGIQVPPLAKTGTSLTTHSKLFSHLSACCRRSSVRRPASPLPHHVHVRLAHAYEQAALLLTRHPRRKNICRNPVAALGEDRHAVDDELEALPPFVGLLSQLQRAQPRPRRGLVNRSRPR